MKVINYVCSLGCLCHVATYLQQNNMRLASYPFDWLCSELSIVESCIKDSFKDFLDKLQEYDCVFYEKIFNDFIGNLLQGTKWIISIKTVNKYNINSDIINTDKIKDNDNLNILFKKLTKLIE